jgi:hypothetical protein
LERPDRHDVRRSVRLDEVAHRRALQDRLFGQRARRAQAERREDPFAQHRVERRTAQHFDQTARDDEARIAVRETRARR